MTMKPLPHRYAVSIVDRPDGYARLLSPGVPELRAAAPTDFGGPGDAWSPEQLLLGAVEACILLTFRALAAASGVGFMSVSVEAEGVVDRAAAGHASRRSCSGLVCSRRPAWTRRGYAERSRRPSTRVSSPHL